VKKAENDQEKSDEERGGKLREQKRKGEANLLKRKFFEKKNGRTARGRARCVQKVARGGTKEGQEQTTLGGSLWFPEPGLS